MLVNGKELAIVPGANLRAANLGNANLRAADLGGADLRRVLSKSVSNRGSAFLAGLGVTSLLQSSSATALITSSFVSQNLLGLAAALAIMLGADVGTSLIAQLFSLDLSWLSPLLIFFGVVFFLPRRRNRLKNRLNVCASHLRVKVLRQSG